MVVQSSVGFSIVFNGLHHLKHNNYAENLLNILDHWVVIEGAANNSGSTSWCKDMPGKYHNKGGSVDGTWDYLKTLDEEHNNITILQVRNCNKESMINQGLLEFKINHWPEYFGYNRDCFLWQIDVDEQWTEDDMKDAEEELSVKNGKTGCFHANHYVGDDLIAKGEWGEGLILPYRRLWRWTGELFDTHEPPVLRGGNGIECLLNQRFNHYSYYFESDVAFKNDWYTGHEGVLERWRALKNETDFPKPISLLITGSWGKTKTEIIKV